MAKVSIILDQRTADNEGRFPIKLRVTTKDSNTTIRTNMYAHAREFIGTCESAVARTCVGAKQINQVVSEMYYTYATAIADLERSGRINAMSAADIREYVNKQKEFHSERNFTSCLIEYRNSCRTFKTQQVYDYTLQMMKRFCNKEKFMFEEINFKFLTDMDHWMESEGKSISCRSIIFRNMRTIYNYAINNDWVNHNMYPFRKFKIKHGGKKEKVYLPEEKMRELLSLDLSNENCWEGLSLARDFFFLSFLLCGINPIDLFNLPRTDQRISFVRQKLKFHEPDPIHIGIQPEAECLISQYKGNEHLINLAEHYYSFESCYRFMTHRLKRLGAMIGCPDITFYWARYSWATYANKIDVPDSTISKALGHADATLAMSTYVTYDWSKVDRANRRVIDYALYGIE